MGRLDGAFIGLENGDDQVDILTCVSCVASQVENGVRMVAGAEVDCRSRPRPDKPEVEILVGPTNRILQN